ncbi:MAG: hypothetical protein WD471_00935 [Candidatus Paceibacterota bacterium]
MTNEKQLSKLLGILVEHMFFFKDISTEDAQWVIQNPKEAISLFIKAVKERSKEIAKNILPTVTSNGKTGQQWIETLEKESFNVSDWAKNILQKDDFNNQVTEDVTYHPVLIKGDEFSDKERITKNIRAEAKRRGYITPPPELAPILRQSVSDEDIKNLDLNWLVVMHEPIIGFDGDPNLLDLDRVDGGHWLRARWGDPGARWVRGFGFVFLAPQVS